LLLILIVIVMTIVARRTRLGRYIFATGGNPEAAALAGINTRLLTVKVFAIMGMLCAISAIVASSRQTFHSNDIGTLDELRVIAAAVIGGTALAGGMGTIYGADPRRIDHAEPAIGHGNGGRRRALSEHGRGFRTCLAV
jgi:D-xylose transport system permease protein